MNHGMILAKREKRLRRRILRVADASKASGGVRGRMLADVLSGDPESPEDDQQLLGLCMDLVNANLLRVTDQRRHTWDRFGLDFLLYQITATGTVLLAEGVEPNPLVEDDRIIGN